MNLFDDIKNESLIKELGLNKNLLIKNKVPEKNIKAMKYYYKKIEFLFDMASILEDTKSQLSEKQYLKEAKMIGKEVERAEKQLQKLWNFKSDPNYYTYWIDIPGCKCPIIDNYDARGEHRIINCDCPYHNFLCK